MTLLLLALALAAPNYGNDPKRLVGQHSNRGGNGAVARIRVGQRTMTGEVRLQFGLGAATEAQAVDVQLPGGALEPIGCLNTITERKGVTGVTRYTQ